MSAANKFGAACANRECNTYVAPRAGIVTRTTDSAQGGGAWVTWCTGCAPGPVGGPRVVPPAV